MWENAFQAIKNDDDRWIDEHHLAFKSFFSESNDKTTGKLSNSALEAHYKHQIFKMYLSREYNGLAYDLVEGSRFIEKASALDGNWGWLLGIGVGGAYFADYLNPQVAQKFFETREALVCGSGMASGTAKSSSDQWLINGIWKFCSGCEHASIMTCVVKRDDQNMAILLTPSDYEIQEDWNGIGMKLTCSHTLSVEDKLVSSDRFFDLQKPPRKAAYSISSYPFMAFAKACFTPVLGGIAKAIMHTAEEMLQEKKNNNKAQYNKKNQFVESFLEKFKKENHNLRSNFSYRPKKCV